MAFRKPRVRFPGRGPLLLVLPSIDATAAAADSDRVTPGIDESTVHSRIISTEGAGIAIG